MCIKATETCDVADLEILTEHTGVSFGLGTIINSLVTQRLTMDNKYFFSTHRKHSWLTTTRAWYSCVLKKMDESVMCSVTHCSPSPGQNT